VGELRCVGKLLVGAREAQIQGERLTMTTGPKASVSNSMISLEGRTYGGAGGRGHILVAAIFGGAKCGEQRKVIHAHRRPHPIRIIGRKLQAKSFCRQSAALPGTRGPHTPTHAGSCSTPPTAHALAEDTQVVTRV
jgi:hypothetical protein